jgi:hypothetical protein
MKKYTLTFNGTDEQLLLGATYNGYTGFKTITSLEGVADENGNPIREEETVEEFMCRILIQIPPEQFIKNAVLGIEVQKGKENYDAKTMFEAMVNLITIESNE